MQLNTYTSFLTETGILYIDGHTDSQTDWFQYTPENIRVVGLE